ncbi:High affinity cAMP-specific and IBMX-insensitive 3',5'-cyclic phosphodiesterase 8A [Nosema granulosis]|uniref:High affinity cAMP-specific and IBMX-insensitive 3',5'-cyclic phosphodiesterase 8A n=1 Tax=Nosema granulosis TaxID=83296 RepID=A0A9P6KY98_9MICR|nr:High affinity cAMP-specific and IBMX-insensitive 3',5'-cyclic phosphodiesterase 8A [Nosema granulosis]
MVNIPEHEQPFYVFYYNLEKKENLEIAMNLFETSLDLKSLNINKDRFKNFLKDAIDLYKPVSYHNSDHALNTLNTGAYFLRQLKMYTIKQGEKMIFLLACYLHDIGHPGSKDFKNNSVELEKHHVRLIQQQMTKYKDVFMYNGNNIMKYMDLFTELIYSTNLLYHEDVLRKFTRKYFTEVDRTLIPKEGVGPEIKEIELKTLIKIADISATYKSYKTFRKSSLFLNQEVQGKAFKVCTESHQEDKDFLNMYSLPLIERFSAIFKNFKFLHENCKLNLELLEQE